MFDSITPENVIIWIAVGGGVGWLFEAVFKRAGRGSSSDIAVGIFGAVVGAVIMSDIDPPFVLWDKPSTQALWSLSGALVALIAMTLFERVS